MADVITFYRVTDPYGCFSNFSPHKVYLDGTTWPTTEHYFQAQKFLDYQYRWDILRAPSPMIAARMGRDRSKPLRSDWEQIKDDIMRQALRAKVLQHADVREILLATGDALIVEHTTNDHYWADGGDGSGKNRLGRLWMEVRTELTKDAIQRTCPHTPTSVAELSRYTSILDWLENGRWRRVYVQLGGLV